MSFPAFYGCAEDNSSRILLFWSCAGLCGGCAGIFFNTILFRYNIVGFVLDYQISRIDFFPKLVVYFLTITDAATDQGHATGRLQQGSWINHRSAEWLKTQRDGQGLSNFNGWQEMA